ncbi:MAG: hypothetical protein KBH03_01555 [Paludibacteraceae bacterium]|jgi:desulfoferrodoxin (superoxide reductase-like protein)|nr:hypothetical protein [Paludibacteraceae bacterium]
MKKLFFLTTMAISTVFFAKADPAKKVNLTYQNGKLKIEAIHKVKDPQKHYIDQIVINIDGKDVKTVTLKFQNSKDAELLEIPIDLKKGTKVKATTRCNEFGIKKGEITIE